jgi:hypothetical protein
MNLMKDLMEANLPNLTDNQKGMLISIKTSATPQQAMATANGSQVSVAAKNDLTKMGLVAQQGNYLQLTQQGQNALLSNNLIDETGAITEEGQTQLDNFGRNKQEYVNLESFDLIKSFYP